MEIIRDRRSSGMSRGVLRIWGMLFLTIGMVGRGILQTRLLGIGSVSGEQLLAALEASPNMMLMATISLVMSALEICALPIFAFMLVEGWHNTRDFRKYMLRLAAVAALSEIPYDMTMSGKLLDFSSQNPAFGLLLGLVVLYFYTIYPGKSAKNVFIKLLVTVCAIGWAAMLKIEYAACMVLTVVTLHLFWKKPNIRSMAGATVTLVCSVSSLLFMVAPMGFLVVHLYNGEKPEEENRILNYLAYPMLLLAVALVGMFAL